jgi:hypothetical protein
LREILHALHRDLITIIIIVAPIIDDYICEKVSCGAVMKGATGKGAMKEGIQRFWVRIQGTSKFVNNGIKDFCWKGYITGILHHYCSETSAARVVNLEDHRSWIFYPG